MTCGKRRPDANPGMDKWVKRFNSAPLHRKKENSSSESLRTFSVSLDHLIRRDSADIPIIMRKLCQHILDVGISLEGIFRVNGNARLMENLRTEFDTTGDADLSACKDIYGIAGLLKYFLRELPDGLIPESFTNGFIEVISENDEDAVIIDQFQKLLESLPTVNFSCMKFLCQFLRQIADHEYLNKMSPVSLGIVFGPNVFRCGEDIRGLQNQGFTNQIMSMFIDRYFDVFESQLSTSSRVIHVQESAHDDPDRIIRLKTYPKVSSADKFDPRPKPRTSLQPRQQPSVRVSDEVSSPRVQSPIALDRSFADFEWNSYASPRVINHDHISPTIQGAIRAVVSENLFGTEEAVVPPTNMETSFPTRDQDLEPFRSDNGVEEMQLSDMDHTGLTAKVTTPPLNEKRFNTEPLHRHRPRSAFMGSSENVHSVTAVPATGSNLVPSLDLTGINGDRRTRPFAPASESCSGHATLQGRVDSDDQNDMEEKAKRPSPALASPASTIVDEEERARRQQLRSQTLKRIRALKARLRIYEETFVREHGRPPTAAEKSSAPEEEVRLCWNQLGRERRMLRRLREREGGSGAPVGVESGGESAAGEGESESEQSLPPGALAATGSANYNGRSTALVAGDERLSELPNSGALTSATSSIVSTQKETPSSSSRNISDSLDLIMTRLMEKRRQAGRPEALSSMSESQVRGEKLALQKALLYFENIHGRPRTSEEKEVMKPLYDRYRAVKRLLGRGGSGGHTTPNSGLQSSSVINVPTAGRDDEPDEDVFQLTRDFRLISSTTSTGNVASRNFPQDPVVGRRTMGITESATLDRNSEPREADLRVLLETQCNLKSEKKKLQRLLKQFEHEFESTTGHKVEKEDRVPMRTEYNQYKRIKTKLKQVERRIESLTYATK